MLGGGGGVVGRSTLKGLRYLLSDKRWNLFKETNREETVEKRRGTHMGFPKCFNYRHHFKLI